MRILTSLLLSLTLLSCGVYSFRSTNLPPEIQTIYIPIFESNLSGDDLTIDIREDVTTAVQEEFLRLTRLTLDDEENADAVFIGALNRYTRDVSNFDENENPTEYRITLSLKGEFRNLVADEVIWQSSLSSFTFYEVDEGQDDLGEGDALNELIEKAARDLVLKATENW